jgi:glycosyltransferase involved in cell wall biosynthesis
MPAKILSIVPRGYLPKLSGGLEICAMETIEFFSSKGFYCHVAAKANSNFFHRLIKYIFGPYALSYRHINHQVHTDIWHPSGLKTLTSKLKPDVIICHVSMCDDLIEKLISLNIPTLFYIHTREISSEFKKINAKHPFEFACESTFIKTQFQKVINLPISIIRPVLPREKFTVDKTGQHILVVNPHPKKGGETILKIINALPNRSFLIIGGWGNTTNDSDIIRIESKLSKLPNVKRIDHLNDMTIAFKQSRCLLMPCIVEEAFGRTAAEALIAGLPVIASDKGALPETVGSGGVIVNSNAPINNWLIEIEKMFESDNYYASLKNKAIQVSLEPTRQEAYIHKQLIQTINELINTARA